MLEDVLVRCSGDMRTVRDEGGGVISAMVTVRDERCVYAWISGSVPGKNSSGAFFPPVLGCGETILVEP